MMGSKVWTYQLEDGDSITIEAGFGLKKISIAVPNSSASDATVQGSQKIGTYDSTSITIAIGSGVTISGTDSSGTVEGYTITAGAGGTVNIIGLI